MVESRISVICIQSLTIDNDYVDQLLHVETDDKNKFNALLYHNNKYNHTFYTEISNKQLAKIILTSKFDIEKAKKRLDSIYTLRSLIPEFFGNYDPLNDNIIENRKQM